MEIYNENISDLLAGRDTKNRSLAIREDHTGLVYVADLKEECANCEKNVSDRVISALDILCSSTLPLLIATLFVFSLSSLASCIILCQSLESHASVWHGFIFSLSLLLSVLCVFSSCTPTAVCPGSHPHFVFFSHAIFHMPFTYCWTVIV